MTGLNDFLKRSWKTIVIVFVFAGILLIGLVIYDDYGIAYDETIERTTTFVNLKYILETIHPQIRLPEVFDEIPDLAEWKDRYYGVAVQLPAAMIEWMTGFKFSQFTIYRIRHLWIFLQFYAALIFFFLLLRRRFASVRTAIIGVLLLWLSPRIFSDTFYNIKDLPFLSWIVISLYFMFRWLENRSRRYLILFSVVSAVAINIRIVGGMLIAIATGILVGQLFRREKLPKAIAAEALTIFLVSAVVWILITPLAWRNPVRVFGDTLRTFSSYPHYTRELYFGKRYLNTQLPWHYLPVWIGITTPVLVIFGFLTCLFWKIGTFVRRFFNGDMPRSIAASTVQRSFDRGILALIFIPIFFTTLFHSPIYNGWRHFYFAYPWIVYFAVDWIDRLSKSKFSFVRTAIFSLVGMSLIYNASWIIRVHPYQFIYFNEIFPRNIRTGFEKDYWCVSCRDFLRQLLDQDPNLRIGIDAWGMVLSQSFDGLREDEAERLIYVFGGDDYSEIDYFLVSYTGYVESPFYNPAYEKVDEMVVDDLPLFGIYRRVKDRFVDSQNLTVLSVEAENGAVALEALTDWDRKTEWSYDETGNEKKISLLIELDEPRLVYGVTLRTVIQLHGVPDLVVISTSADGETYRPVTLTDTSYAEFFFEPVEARYVRIEGAEAGTDWRLNEVQLWNYTEAKQSGSDAGEM